MFGCSSFAVFGIPDDLGDLVADEIGGGVVGGLVEREIVVDRHEGEPAAAPARLVFRAAFVVAVIERAAVGHLGIDAVARLFARKAPDLRIFRRGMPRAPPSVSAALRAGIEKFAVR